MYKILRSTMVVSASLAALIFGVDIKADVVSQTVNLPLTQTDFGSGSGVAGNPLLFKQFDTIQGSRTLDSVTLSFSASITNTFSMRFTTPATIIDSVATGTPGAPGPTITLFQPDGTTSLLTVSAPNDSSFLTRSITYGYGAGQTLSQAFGSQFATNSPFYIAPAVAQASSTTTTSALSDLRLFTGTGNLGLPVAARAIGSFSSSSGNGFGRIITSATASITVSYNYHLNPPAGQMIPEPSSLVLAGLGSVGLLAYTRRKLRV